MSTTSISVPQVGMIRDEQSSELLGNEYTFMLNGNISGERGKGKLQNEPSNLLCKRFDEYKVIGYRNDPSGQATYFFITNPIVGDSKLVYLESTDMNFDDEFGIGQNIRDMLSGQMELSESRYNEICGQI